MCVIIPHRCRSSVLKGLLCVHSIESQKSPVGLEGQNSDIICVLSHVHAGPRLTEQTRSKSSVFLQLPPFPQEYRNNSGGD